MVHFFQRLFAVLFLPIATCLLIGKQSFDNGNYVVEWKTLPATKEIEFKVVANATGWLALGITKENTGMKKMDTFVGGVNSAGQPYLWDMYVNDKIRPIKDPQNNVEILNASERNGTTNITFKRKLDTEDAANDNVIQANESYYLDWAYESTDDATDPSTFKPHSKKGLSASIVLSDESATYSETTMVTTQEAKPGPTAVASMFGPAIHAIAVAVAVFQLFFN